MKINKKTLLIFGAFALSAITLSAQTPPAAPAPPAPPTPAVFSMLVGGNYLGVVADDVDKDDAQRLSLREQRGVIVKTVRENSPAAKAGLQKDDVILRFDGEAVTSMRKLTRLIEESAPEQKVRITVLRNGQERDIEAMLTARRAEFSNLSALSGIQGFELNGKELNTLRGQLGELQAGQTPLALFGARRRIGISTTELTEQLSEYFGVSGKGGLLISNVEKDSPAEKAGLKAGDIIIEANGAKLNNPAELIQAISKQEEGDVTLTIIRNKSQQTLKVTPEKMKPINFQGFIAPRAITQTTAPLRALTSRPARLTPLRTYKPTRILE